MTVPEQTTAELIQQFKREPQREEAFRALFERHYAPVCRFFSRKNFSPEDSRDLTQETFFSVYRELSGLHDEARFESWLFRIARNVYHNELERRQAQKRAAGEVPLEGDGNSDDDLRAPIRWLADPAADPMTVVLEREKLEKLREALQELSPQMRRCIYLRLVDEASPQEIAATLGVSINTVKAHLYQGRKILQHRLRQHFGELEL